MTRLIVRHQNLLTCVALVAWVLFTFDDVVLRGLNLAFAGLDTGVPNDDAKVLLYLFFVRPAVIKGRALRGFVAALDL